MTKGVFRHSSNHQSAIEKAAGWIVAVTLAFGFASVGWAATAEGVAEAKQGRLGGPGGHCAYVRIGNAALTAWHCARLAPERTLVNGNPEEDWALLGPESGSPEEFVDGSEPNDGEEVIVSALPRQTRGKVSGKFPGGYRVLAEEAVCPGSSGAGVWRRLRGGKAELAGIVSSGRGPECSREIIVSSGWIARLRRI